MPDPFDDARRSLDEVPAPDLWDEAQRRAAAGKAVPLSDGEARRSRRPGRWLAVAAAAALAVGTLAVLVDDDDQSVDTTPGTDAAGPTTSIVGAEGCFYGVSGDPIVLVDGPADPPLFDPAGQPAGQTISHADLGSQVAEVQVPGLVVRDLVGERVEEVELTRGTALVWFGADFVQVRWFTGSQEPCESFTVTVAGGTEDGNRHAAVDLAERILLPAEIGVEEPPRGSSTTSTTWPPSTTSTDGVTTTTTTVGTSTSGGEGVQGTVTAGPTCPVEQPDQPCPPQPLAIHIVASDSAGRAVAETDSAADGSYAMALPAGRYTLRAGTGGAPPTCPDTDITVPIGTRAVADISCDTGIR